MSNCLRMTVYLGGKHLPWHELKAREVDQRYTPSELAVLLTIVAQASDSGWCDCSLRDLLKWMHIRNNAEKRQKYAQALNGLLNRWHSSDSIRIRGQVSFDPAEGSVQHPVRVYRGRPVTGKRVTITADEFRALRSCAIGHRASIERTLLVYLVMKSFMTTHVIDGVKRAAGCISQSWLAERSGLSCDTVMAYVKMLCEGKMISKRSKAGWPNSYCRVGDEAALEKAFEAEEQERQEWLRRMQEEEDRAIMESWAHEVANDEYVC